MKTVLTENEANRVAPDAVTLAYQKLPRNDQDEMDKTLARHFLLQGLATAVNSQLEKLKDQAKELFKQGHSVELTTYYRREVTLGSVRQLFDQDAFITEVADKFGIEKHKLKEIALKSTKPSQSISVKVEYIGDTRAAGTQ